MNYNLVPLSYNIARIYEIVRSGGHTVKILGENEKDIALLYEFYNLEAAESPDIFCEYFRPSADEILLSLFGKANTETKAEIDSRINTFHQKYDAGEIEFNGKIEGGSKALLKTAIDRLKLSLSEILSVLSVAKTIALMAGKNEYGAEHIAEAISYKTKS